MKNLYKSSWDHVSIQVYSPLDIIHLGDLKNQAQIYLKIGQKSCLNWQKKKMSKIMPKMSV